MNVQSPEELDTVELLRRAVAAIEEAGIPPGLHPVALQIAADDLRSRRAPVAQAPAPRTEAPPPSPDKKAAAERKATLRGGAVLGDLPDEDDFFAAIEKEMGVAVSDLSDIFHIEDGRLELKVPLKVLGNSKRAQAQAVTTLLAGAVFAGTRERKLSFTEISQVCDAKNCLDSAHLASSIKATSGFGTVGSGRAQAVVRKSGWQDAFATAARRVLGKPDPGT